MLTDEHWAGADLHEIVRQAAGPYVADHRARVTITGPEVKTPPRLALSLALTFHELATNAAKYGAFSRASGRVDVRWDLTKDERRTVIDLLWRESGGPPVTEPTRIGFGTRLIERSVLSEPGGRVLLNYEPDGLQCRLVVSLSDDVIMIV